MSTTTFGAPSSVRDEFGIISIADIRYDSALLDDTVSKARRSGAIDLLLGDDWLDEITRSPEAEIQIDDLNAALVEIEKPRTRSYEFDFMVLDKTERVLDELESDGRLSTMLGYEIADHVICEVNGKITDTNAARNQKDNKFTHLKRLTLPQIAKIMTRRQDVRLVQLAVNREGPNAYELGVYQHTGDDEGLYVLGEDEIFRHGYDLCPTLSKKRDMGDLMAMLATMVPRVKHCADSDVIAVDNGIFRLSTQTLEPFSPDYVFTTKVRTRYRTFASDEAVYRPLSNGELWDVVSWVNDLSDEEDVRTLLWQVVFATMHYTGNYGKTILLYDERGANGKSTFLKMLRGLVGSGNWTAIRLDEKLDSPMLEDLPGKMVIINDENAVGRTIRSTEVLKLLTTGDALMINRKFKTPIVYSHLGLNIQAINGIPLFVDTTGSLDRRILGVPFMKMFKGKDDLVEIKRDFVVDREVLEYVMWYALTQIPRFEKFVEPESSALIIEKIKEQGDVIDTFVKEEFLATKASDDGTSNVILMAEMYDHVKRYLEAMGEDPKLFPAKSTMKKVLTALNRHHPDEEWGYGRCWIPEKGKRENVFARRADVSEGMWAEMHKSMRRTSSSTRG